MVNGLKVLVPRVGSSSAEVLWGRDDADVYPCRGLNHE